MKNKVTIEEEIAIRAALRIHGVKKTKSAIRQAWMYGTYRDECLEDYSSVLQNMRNREGGRRALETVRLKDLS